MPSPSPSKRCWSAERPCSRRPRRHRWRISSKGCPQRRWRMAQRSSTRTMRKRSLVIFLFPHIRPVPWVVGVKTCFPLAPISRSQRKAWGLISIAYLGMSFPTPLRLLKPQGIHIHLLVHRFGLSPMGGPDIKVNLCRLFGGHRDSRVEVSLKILEPGLGSRVFRGTLFRGKSPEYF